MSLFLVRIAPEMATKSARTRRRFLRQLVHNVGDALDAGGIEHRVEPQWSHLLVDASDTGALERLVSVFGVSSVSPVDERVPAELEAIVEAGESRYAERVRGRTFAVRARGASRSGLSTRRIMVDLGAALDRHGDVNLDQPDVTVRVDVRDGEAFLLSERIPGMGGLPLGVEGKAVALLSGGFDSAVAAWLMLKRGVALHYVFCNLGGEAYERTVASVAKVLADQWSHGTRPTIHVVDFLEMVAELERSVQAKYWQVVLKRLMYRAAEAVARELQASAIVTGESVGQVSSQTLGNLRAIDDVATLPVLRPVLGLDKNEIIARAERIGTASISAHVREYCAILERRPVTNAKPHAARDEESRVDLAVLKGAVAARRILYLRALEPADLVQPYVFATEIPDGAVVFDCREPLAYESWHYPGAARRDPTDLLSRLRELDRERRYILYCAVGVQSAYVAEEMQRAGFEAYSFRGGAPALERLVRPRGAVAATPGS